jgi:hypothetical protein
MVDLTKVYWSYTTFRRCTVWIPEVCSVGLAKEYPDGILGVLDTRLFVEFH